MSEHIEGTHRSQTVLFPDSVDKYVAKENPVRVIDAFVESLNLEKTRVQTLPS
jgi:transposase